MASGDNVVLILEAIPPTTLAAPQSTITGGGTPGEPLESVSIFSFDDTVTTYMDFRATLFGYDGGGLTLNLFWSAASAVSGTVQWQIAIRRMAEGVDVITDTHPYSYQTNSVPAPAVVNRIDRLTVTFTNGAQMDSWADGEIAVIRVRRNVNSPDTMIGDARLWGPPIGFET